MIGLGSNRLRVCRRGGMSVTQAGRGGMEWLAGTGSRSPYSAQAAAALKAQFPTQWPTIRDYGFAHPEIVPYVNNTPMIAPYVSGVVEPDKNYPLITSETFKTGVYSTLQTTVHFWYHYDQATTGEISPLRIGSYGGTTYIYPYIANYQGQNAICAFYGNGTSGSTVKTTMSASVAGKYIESYLSHSVYRNTVDGQTVSANYTGSWKGNEITIGLKNYATWQILSVLENGIETHRFFALADKIAWDYVTGTLIDNN